MNLRQLYCYYDYYVINIGDFIYYTNYMKILNNMCAI